VAKRKPKSSLIDDARDLLINAAADDFARALDLCGWMIVPQPEYASYPDGLWKPKWRMNHRSPDCPAWAHNAPEVDSAEDAIERSLLKGLTQFRPYLGGSWGLLEYPKVLPFKCIDGGKNDPGEAT
jgi:hypothetical protein